MSTSKTGTPSEKGEHHENTLLAQRLDNEWKVSVETAVGPITLLARSIWLGNLTLHTDISMESVDIRVQLVTLDALHNVDNIW